MTIKFSAPVTLDLVEPTPKPAKMEVHAENIPSELHVLPRFVAWQWRWKPEASKWDKPPLQVDGTNAKSNDPKTWVTFGEALAALDSFDGIGFMLRDSGIVGVDLDNCRDPATGVIREPHASVIHTLNSYAEVSPSGTGVKLLVHAKLPPKCPHANHADGFEVYDKQYFTLTGHRVPGTPATINDRQSQIEFVTHKFVAPKKHERNGHGNLAGMSFDPTDDVALARSALSLD
jgi:putative DNA primase/helicase